MPSRAVELPAIRIFHVSHASFCLDLSRWNQIAFVCLPSNRKLTHHLTAPWNTVCRKTAGWDERLSRHTGNALQQSEACTLRRYILHPGIRGPPFFPAGDSVLLACGLVKNIVLWLFLWNPHVLKTTICFQEWMLKMKYDAKQPLFVAAEPFQPLLYNKDFQMQLLLISPKVVTPVSAHIFNSSLHMVKELKENIGSLHKLRHHSACP